MIVNKCDQVIRENFDLSDSYTRKYIVSLTEAQKEQLLDSLSNALYDQIVSKVDDIDFGTIPRSRGDITRVDGFANTEKCLDIIRRLVIEYKESTQPVDVILSAIQNVKDRKSTFIKGYSLNAELPMLMYNLIVLSIERSVSLMIATCVEYVKDGGATIKIALDRAAYKKSMEDLMYNQLTYFNSICVDKTFDRTMDQAFKNVATKENSYDILTQNTTSTNEDFSDTTGSPFGSEEDEVPEQRTELPSDEEIPATQPELPDDFEEAPANDSEDISGVPAADDTPVDNSLSLAEKKLNEGFIPNPFTFLRLIIDLLRNLVYTFYYTKAKMSDYLAVQADLIDANANELEHSTDTELSEDEKSKAANRQRKFADKLRKWSNFFSIDKKSADNNVQKNKAEDDRNRKKIAKNDDDEDSIF